MRIVHAHTEIKADFGWKALHVTFYQIPVVKYLCEVVKVNTEDAMLGSEAKFC